ncbi:MAG TPA: hypothetical protein VJZ00_09090 [Thermoanaerobaculia bacterium]|nr:hypothetical protein [Thermoanaerobaculia bacterium]
MNITCSQFDDLLFDASPLAMETAARHAEECESCAQTLADWMDIESTAKSMHTTWQSDLLWPRIERAIRHERRTPMRRLWQIAASFLLVVSLGGTMFYALRVQSREADFDTHLIRMSAVDEADKAERDYERAIKNLEKVADAKLDEAETPVMVSYKEKLMLLDDAIAECQAQIENNRQNAHLRNQLLSMYSEKQQTLRDVLREESHVSNP